VPPATRALRAAAPISGTTLDGDAVTLSFGPGSPVTLLAFLTSGCTSCAPLWSGLGDAPLHPDLAERVVIVTHGTSRRARPGSAGWLRRGSTP